MPLTADIARVGGRPRQLVEPPQRPREVRLDQRGPSEEELLPAGDPAVRRLQRRQRGAGRLGIPADHRRVREVEADLRRRCLVGERPIAVEQRQRLDEPRLRILGRLAADPRL